MTIYKQNGMLCRFAGYENHLGFYPGGIVEKFADELTELKTSKGTIQFTPKKTIPDKLLKRMVEAKFSENLSKVNTKK